MRGAGEDQTIYHAGTGSAVNNYLVQTARIEQQFYDAGGKDPFELESSNFANCLDSTRAVYDHYHRHYTDSVAISDELSNALQMRNRLKLVTDS